MARHIIHHSTKSFGKVLYKVYKLKIFSATNISPYNFVVYTHSIPKQSTLISFVNCLEVSNLILTWQLEAINRIYWFGMNHLLCTISYLQKLFTFYTFLPYLLCFYIHLVYKMKDIVTYNIWLWKLNAYGTTGNEAQNMLLSWSQQIMKTRQRNQSSILTLPCLVLVETSLVK